MMVRALSCSHWTIDPRCRSDGATALLEASDYGPMGACVTVA